MLSTNARNYTILQPHRCADKSSLAPGASLEMKDSLALIELKRDAAHITIKKKLSNFVYLSFIVFRNLIGRSWCFELECSALSAKPYELGGSWNKNIQHAEPNVHTGLLLGCLPLLVYRDFLALEVRKQILRCFQYSNVRVLRILNCFVVFFLA